jgi:hydroxyacylglutathione hydrolase
VRGSSGSVSWRARLRVDRPPAPWYHGGVPTRAVSERVFAVGSPIVSFYVYRDGNETICIDSGTTARAARAGLERIGLDPSRVSHVFLTHSDGDHVGGLGAFPNAQVHLPRAEEPMARGERGRRLLFVKHRNHLGVPWAPVDDGQQIMVGSIVVRAIATPGHTVGSTSYLVNGEALFTGDLIALKRGRARTSSAIITEDVAEDARSIARLASAVSAAALLCTAHTGYTRDYALAMEGWRAETL